MKKAIQTTMDFGALGIKLRVAGRLNGAEISRAELIRDGKTPLHTLRAHIDYGFHEANTLYGKIGVKCWVCKPDPNSPQAQEALAAAENRERDRPRGRGPRRDGGGGPRRDAGAPAPGGESAGATSDPVAPAPAPRYRGRGQRLKRTLRS